MTNERNRPRWLRRAATIGALALATLALAPREARAHCDALDGPVVTAARRALETGALAPMLVWVRPQDEAEIGQAFAHARTVRALGPEARELADRFFFETVVRVHRAGEGEPYTGLKPAGMDHGPVIPAVDRALAGGSPAQVEALLVEAVRHGLHERWERAATTRRFAPDDLAAGRAHVAAYVSLMHWAEGVHRLAAEGAHGHAATPAAEGAAHPKH